MLTQHFVFPVSCSILSTASTFGHVVLEIGSTLRRDSKNMNVVHDLLERSVRNRPSKHEIIDKELQHENIKENERLI